MFAGDLSKYRSFELGADLPSVAKASGSDAAQARLVHSRPALLQELEWRPPFGNFSSHADAARRVLLSFYNGQLFQITIDYNRDEIAGMTAEDLVEGVSATYGPSSKPAIAMKPTDGRYGDQEEIVAQWIDETHRFDLIHSSYGPSFRLVGVLKSLEAPAKAAMIEGARLDEVEAPQKELDRAAKESAAERTKLEQARLANKGKFQP